MNEHDNLLTKTNNAFNLITFYFNKYQCDEVTIIDNEFSTL